MVGLEVGDKALFTRKYLDELGKTHGPVNDFIYGVNRFLIGLAEQFGASVRPCTTRLPWLWPWIRLW